MRPLVLGLLAVAAAGCQLPEYQLVLTGRVVEDNVPRAGVEVRLLRDEVSSDTRCGRLRPLASTVTGPDGSYRFGLIRQQVTLGLPGRRFFRAEVTGPEGETVSSYDFWFPNGDLELPDLPTGDLFASFDVTFPGESSEERLLDGQVAWRVKAGAGAPRFDRATRLRRVWNRTRWLDVQVDDLGTVEQVRAVLRIESPEVTVGAALSQPYTRGVPCPGLGVEPCPVTDGRFLPVALPDNTRVVVLDLGTERPVNRVRLYGLELTRPAAKVRVEWSPVFPPSWSPYNSAAVDPRVFVAAGEHCLEPGAFLAVDVPVQRFPNPRAIRLSTPDAAGQLVPWRSVQEVEVE